MIGTYQFGWVLVSYLVASVAAYTALKTLGRIHASRDSGRRWWLLAGGLSMGVGIWSMHFVGMLAFRLPIPLGYNLWITTASLLLAIGTSTFALWLVSRSNMTRLHLVGGAVAMGLGIAAMHYVGMAAMLMNPAIQYHPGWFLTSILIAVLAAGIALSMAYRLRDDANHSHQVQRIVAGMVMGLAIVGMHYTGMAAARFSEDAICGAARTGGLTPDMLGALVVLFNIAVLGTAIGISTLDRLLRERTAKLSDSLHSANSQLIHLATHDVLTSLPNRRCLLERLQQRVEEASRQQRYFAVLFVDLDGFKDVNDAFGHHVGDALLVHAARVLEHLLDTKGCVARLGGDEFVAVADIDHPDEATMLAESVLMGLRSNPLLEAEEAIGVTASIGTAVFPEDGVDPQALLAHADAAMYAIKQSGRNGVCHFTPLLSESAHAQAQLGHELSKAMSRREFLLHYQPLTDSASGQLAGCEALLRWQHPRLGLVYPDRFIGMAERLGLISELGAWAMDEACRQWSQWRDAGLVLPTLSVNLSSLQLRGCLLVDQVSKCLARHGIPPQVLTLEMTESVEMLESAATATLLTRLADAGARISIDDFGTGFSSFAYLADLPAHELKIDRQFIARLDKGERQVAIIRSVIQLAVKLGMDVVAEGIETPEQAQLLRALGCTRLQGWHVGRPVPADQFPFVSKVGG